MSSRVYPSGKTIRSTFSGGAELGVGALSCASPRTRRRRPRERRLAAAMSTSKAQEPPRDDAAPAGELVRALTAAASAAGHSR